MHNTQATTAGVVIPGAGGTVPVPAWLMESAVARPRTCRGLVLWGALWLMRKARDAGRSLIARYAKLAERMGVSRSTVKRARRDLIDAGALTTRRRGRLGAEWALCDTPADAPAAPAAPAVNEPVFVAALHARAGHRIPPLTAFERRVLVRAATTLHLTPVQVADAWRNAPPPAGAGAWQPVNVAEWLAQLAGHDVAAAAVRDAAVTHARWRPGGGLPFVIATPLRPADRALSFPPHESASARHP